MAEPKSPPPWEIPPAIRGRRLQWLAKRAADYSAAAGALVLAAPALLAIAAAIRLDTPGAPVYAQTRVGYRGRTFTLLKFRTMVTGAPLQFNADGSTRVDAVDARVTRVGKHLRGALDELPQLANILRGELSLVGPRPDLPVHSEQYTPAEWTKLNVPPGITSLAAVLGRNEIPWKQRIAIDLKYIEHWSLWLDARILVQTFCLPMGLRPFSFSDVLDD